MPTGGSNARPRGGCSAPSGSRVPWLRAEGTPIAVSPVWSRHAPCATPCCRPDTRFRSWRISTSFSLPCNSS